MTTRRASRETLNVNAPVEVDIDPDTIRRFERAIADQAASFQVTRDEVTALKSCTAVIQRDMLAMSGNIDKLIARFEDSKKTNWPLLAAICGLVPALLTGALFIISNEVTGAIAPLDADIAQIHGTLNAQQAALKTFGDETVALDRDVKNNAEHESSDAQAIRQLGDDDKRLTARSLASTEADISSKTDRAQLNERMHAMEAETAARASAQSAQIARIQADLVEVEQQFHAVSNIENMRAAEQQRLNAMLWNKLHPKEAYPVQMFFPTSIFQSSPVNAEVTK